MIQALLPLKDLVGAKSRLSGILCPSERRALAQAMVEDVLCVVASHSMIDGVTLVSDDPSAHLLASSYGAHYVDERQLTCRGLNPVVEYCSARLLHKHASVVLVLHGDLPLLKDDDVTAVLQQQAVGGGLVIGTDTDATGTNMLAFDTASKPEFHFGTGSCALHKAWAETADIPVCVLHRQGIACDVDDPGDLDVLLRSDQLPAQSMTKKLLESGLRARVKLALHSLASSKRSTGKRMEEG